MGYKEIMRLLDKAKRDTVRTQYNMRVSPKGNGGLFLSPNQFNETVSDIVSQIIGQKVILKGGTINAVLSRILD